MQPLQRQDSHNSLHSWWSDSNSMLRLSPTVNLHAMAKPLMRFMYHRQALGFIEKNQDAPLSAELLEIYSSYLSCKYVSRRTRRLILDHLLLRASRTGRYSDRSGRDAQEILCSPVLNQILFIPDARDPDSSQSINALIAALVISSSGCDWTKAVIPHVTHVLRTQEGPAAAQALLESFNADVGRCAVELIAALVRPNVWIMSVEPAPPMSFVFDIISTVNWAKLLSHEDDWVQSASIYALSEIADHPDGSRAIIAANILDDLQHSFDSKISIPRGWAWPLIRSLAQHDFTIPHILHANVIDKLVCDTSCPSALKESDNAVLALAAISMSPEGAAAVLAAMSKIEFFNLAALLYSQEWIIKERVCRLISKLAKDRNSASVLLRSSSHLVAALESLLRWESGADLLTYYLEFFDAASTLIQLHKWSGPEKLGNIIAVIREGAATAEVSLEDIPKLMEEIRAAKTFQFQSPF